MNPEAEGAVTDRFQQAKARLRGELHDQLQSRSEQLDEEHSGLEYVRNKAEISALEAKVNTPALLVNIQSLRYADPDLSLKTKVPSNEMIAPIPHFTLFCIPACFDGRCHCCW